MAPDLEKLTISVSSAKSFADCNMQYFLNSVEGIKKPDTPETKIGSDFAKFTEALAKGLPTFEFLTEEKETIIKLYEKNKEFLDGLSKEVTEAEFKLNFGLNLYISYLGYIDAVLRQPNKIIIRDYKTCGSWFYSLTEQDMGADEQLNIYGYFIHTYYNPDNLPIWLEHQQFNKKSGLRKSPSVPYNHEQGKAVYDWIIKQAEDIIKVRRLKIEEVKKNFDSCKKFGGCPYKEYCSGYIKLEELREVLNPNIKQRSRTELIEMKPEERLAELKAEQGFNKIGEKVIKNLKEGDVIMTVTEKLALIKKQQEEAKKNGAFVAQSGASIVPENVASAIVDTVVKNADAVLTAIKYDNVVTEKQQIEKAVEVIEERDQTIQVPAENPLKTTKRVSKKAVEQKAEFVAIPNKDVQSKEQLATVEQKANAVLVLVGCSILEEEKHHPSDFLHEKYIKPVLEQERIPHISCSEFSKANKSVMIFGQQILQHIFENYTSINIDFRRPVDALVYQMIMDMDVKSDSKRFRLVRSTF